MPCGCHPKKHDNMEFRVPPEDVRGTPPPLADWFTSPRMTLPRDDIHQRRSTTLEIAAQEVSIPHTEWIGPPSAVKGRLTIYDAYEHKLLRVRATVPRPEWRNATGFSTIQTRQIEALEAPRYSFAALDTQGLVDEVYGGR
jgi:hypothetical protein